MGAEAKRYLQDHAIPQLFEGLMTGLIYNKPEDHIQFLENAIQKIRMNPGMAFKWDSFVTSSSSNKMEATKTKSSKESTDGNKVKKKTVENVEPPPHNSPEAAGARPPVASAVISHATNSPKAHRAVRDPSHTTRKGSSQQQNETKSRKNSWSSSSRPSSLVQAANDAYIPPDAPIILFMGGPGGGKTRYAAKLQEELREQGLVHICMPDLIRNSIARYKDRSSEWRVAAERYQRGELIPNELAQQLVKAEMGRHPHAKAYFIEGFPREARQVEDFESNARPVDMALILDYDEEVLRRHMQSRGLFPEVIDRRIDEFKQKTLPSAKYFDDQRLLHLIPGEKEDEVIIERMRKLVLRAMRAGVGGGLTAASTDSASSTAGGKRKQSGDNKGVGQALASNETGISAHKAETATTATNLEGSGTNSVGNTAVVSSTTQMVGGPRPKTMSAGKDGKGVPDAGARAASVVASAASPSAKASSRGSSQRGSAGTTPPGKGAAASNQPKPKNDGDESQIRNRASNSAGTPIDTNANQKGGGGGSTDVSANVPIVLIIGAPGSSKSKFAQNIAKKYDGFVFISLGKLLRRKVMQNAEDELWAKIGKKMDAGEMIPLRICRELLYASIHERTSNSWGFVVEGYPRTLAQAEDIEAQLGHIDLALLIDCTEQFCKDVLQKRYQRDKEEGAERLDDEESVVRIRLAQFKANTLPMLKYLDDHGKLRVVEGDTNEEAVFANMCQIIDNTIFIQDDGNGKSLGSSKRNSADRLPSMDAQKAEEQSK
uniref:Adenylate kinase n=1 Tax=Globodera rostochiensis TaxID=31243 RepID=A0A914IBB1_GLORO